MAGGLLERDAPLAQLGGLARRVARGGPGEVVLLRGEAGVGKTAMLAKFVGQLDSGPRVLRGWCDPLGAPRPLGPLTDALAGLDAPRGRAGRRRRLGGYRTNLSTAAGGVG